MALTFELTTASDLLAKAKREERRLSNAITAEDRVEFADTLFNFAVTAYHVKDWIKCDPSAAAAFSEVEDYVGAQQPLRLCREICNSSKHYALRSTPTDAAAVSASATSLVSPTLADPNRVALETNEAPHFRVTIVTLDGTRLEVRAFASLVVATWERFFTRHRLT
jgi:hypothetical protein